MVKLSSQLRLLQLNRHGEIDQSEEERLNIISPSSYVLRFYKQR